jgi:heme o synthase
MNTARIFKYTLSNYLQVLKPRETTLLAIIGACSAIIASAPVIPVAKFIIVIITIGVGSAGCNGLTNYLDRTIDGRMERTKNRVLPLHLIYPHQKVLPLVLFLIISSLIVSWFLNPVCFVIGIVGVAASSLWRKTITCTFFGIIAGCCPVLIGWFALNQEFTYEILLICMMVAVWIPIHIWSVMISKKADYSNAGLTYFPLNIPVKVTVRIMFVLGLLLASTSFALYFISLFQILYFAVAVLLAIIMLSSLGCLIVNTTSSLAWILYKFSSFPYLGIMFVIMAIDKIVS